MTSPAYTWFPEELKNHLTGAVVKTLPVIITALEQIASGKYDMTNILISIAAGLVIDFLREYSQGPTVDDVESFAKIVQVIIPKSTPIVNMMKPIVEKEINDLSPTN